MGSLVNLGYPTKEEMELADTTARELPDPAAGLPVGDGAEPVPGPPELNQEIDDYVIAFIDLAGKLEALRKPVLQGIPEDDPMHGDEGSFRIVEAKILQDLLALQPSSHVFMTCHNTYERLDKPKPGQDAGQHANRKVASACAMRKSYLQAREGLRMNPDPDTMKVIGYLVVAADREAQRCHIA